MNNGKTRALQILQSVGALLAGIIVMLGFSIATDLALSSAGYIPALGQPLLDSGILFLAAAYRGLYAILGGYVTARLAPYRPLHHALVLGGVGVALNLLGTVVMWEKGPLWYSLSGLIQAMPYAWGGATLRARQKVRVGNGRD